MEMLNYHLIEPLFLESIAAQFGPSDDAVEPETVTFYNLLFGHLLNYRRSSDPSHLAEAAVAIMHLHGKASEEWNAVVDEAEEETIPPTTSVEIKPSWFDRLIAKVQGPTGESKE